MINYNRLGYEIKRDLTNFSTKISKGLKRPQQKFVHQMLYGILAGNKVHFSEIARSLKEDIKLKKTIERLSRNLNSFEEKQSVMRDYLSLVKQHVKEDYAVIVIDNSDIAKPASRKLETLSENFSKRCVRTLDRGFDANEFYRYFMKHNERFVIRAKKNRNVIYNGKTCNIMDAASKYKGNYRMDFKDKKQSIRNLNLFATRAAGYIGLTSSVHAQSIFPKKGKSQKLNLFEHFKIEDTGAFVF